MLRNNEWKSIQGINSSIECTSCGSDNVYCRIVDDYSDEFEDYVYDCHDCDHIWWINNIHKNVSINTQHV